jgi:exonuclease III
MIQVPLSPKNVAYTNRIATLNINDISSLTLIRMLEEFLRRQDIDLMFLQAVTHANINMISQYTAHMNMETDGRGIAVLVKEGLVLTNIQRIPSGRGITAMLIGIRIVYIYIYIYMHHPDRKRSVKGKPSIMEKL